MTKLEQRIEAMQAECFRIWEDKDISISIRARALRLYADIFEDLELYAGPMFPRFEFSRVMEENDKQLMELYREF